ncbi:MAG: helix-turn-helix domain-containing protein [Ruminococcaceae bacterium]|nr:helix-turn-helix domain-containing protein [Oscillospiraceae bacterium]
MIITYDIEKLKEIIDNICTVIGVSMGIIDTKLNFIYKKNLSTDAVCLKIHNTNEGIAKCSCSDIDLVKKCEKERKPVSHICHAGLLDTVVPVIKNSKIVAYIIIGRVRPEKNMENTIDKSICDKYDITLNDYNQMTHLSEEQMAGFIKLISHILFDNSIEIDYGEFLAAVTDYIDNNLTENLTVETICTQFFVSKNYLYKSFRSFYNCTVNEYITNQRIKIAARLLTDTVDNASMIAERVGIYNYTYFSRLFKKHTGLSPSKYRQIKNKKNKKHHNL